MIKKRLFDNSTIKFNGFIDKTMESLNDKRIKGSWRLLKEDKDVDAIIEHRNGTRFEIYNESLVDGKDLTIIQVKKNGISKVVGNYSFNDVNRASRSLQESVRIICEAEEDSDSDKKIEVPDDFKKKQSYKDFVKHLLDGVNDEKARAWIDYAFGNEDSDIKFTAESPTGVPVSVLRPTQNFIGFENSIGFTVANPGKAKDSLTKMLTENSPTITPGKPIWIFEGKYIIDGHHRWSQVYAFNPNAKVMAINFTSSEKLTPKQALASVQGVIASVTNNVPIATSKVDGKDTVAANVLEASEGELLKAAANQIEDVGGEGFESLCRGILGIGNKAEDDEEEKGPSPVDKIKRISEVPSAMKDIYDDYPNATVVLTQAVRNCLDLKADNKAISGAPEREYMPQTDGGKGAPANTPDKVQTALSKGVDDVVKLVDHKILKRTRR